MSNNIDNTINNSDIPEKLKYIKKDNKINHLFLSQLEFLINGLTYTLTTTHQNQTQTKKIMSSKNYNKFIENYNLTINSLKSNIKHFINDNDIISNLNKLNKLNKSKKSNISNHINICIELVIQIVEQFVVKLVVNKEPSYMNTEEYQKELLELYRNVSYFKTNYNGTEGEIDFKYNNLINPSSLLYNIIKNFIKSETIKLDILNNILQIPICTYLYKKKFNSTQYFYISIFLNILSYIKHYIFTILFHTNNNFRIFTKEAGLVIKNDNKYKPFFNHFELNNFENFYILFKQFSNTNIMIDEFNKNKNYINNQSNITNNKHNDQSYNFNTNNNSNSNVSSLTNNSIQKITKISDYCKSIYFVCAHGGVYSDSLYLMRRDYTLSFINDFNSFGIFNYDNIIVPSFINKNKDGKFSIKNIENAKNYHFGMFVPYQSFDFYLIPNDKNNKSECVNDNNWSYSGIVNFKNAFKRFDTSLSKEEEKNIASQFCFYNTSNTNKKFIKRISSVYQIKSNQQTNNERKRRDNLKKIIFKYNENNIISKYYLKFHKNYNIEDLIYFISNSKKVKDGSRFIFDSCRKINQNDQLNTQSKIKDIVDLIIQIQKLMQKKNENNQNLTTNNKNNIISLSSVSVKIRGGSNYSIFDIVNYVKSEIFNIKVENNFNNINNIINTSNKIKNKFSNNDIYTLIKFIKDVDNECVNKFNMNDVIKSLQIIIKLLE